ncbi:MAG: hypothetical protein ACK5DG_05690 [Chitinophagaceae bacterium]
MKLKLRIVFLVAVIALVSSCSRSLTPYEAANGKRHSGKCLKIR